jgi:hypothetical protein
MTLFTNLISEKINIIEKIALRMLPKDSFLKNFENMDEQKLIDQYKAEEAKNPLFKKQPKITKYDEISIWVKMFAYIIYNIHYDQRLDNIENGKDPNYELFGIDSILIYLEKENDSSANIVKKQKDKKSKNDLNDNNNPNNEEIEGVSNNNKYENELKKAFVDFCEKRKEAGFFNKKTFNLKKQKRFRINKKANNHIVFYSSHLQYYYFDFPNSNKLYNLDFVLNCKVHEVNKKYDFSCEKCKDNFYLYYNTYILIYDLCVKYFLIPEKFSYYEKEIYVGYYLSKILKDKQNDDEKLTNKQIIEYKYNQFIKQLEVIMKIPFCIKSLSDLEKYSEMSPKEFKNILKKDDEEDYMIHPLEKLKDLYKKFVIWNSLYLIMLKKYPYFVKELKDNSITNNFIEDAKEKYGKDNYFFQYFTKIFHLDNKDQSDEKERLDIMLIKQKLREYGAKTQTKIENFDLSLRSFYENGDRYLVDDININNIEEFCPFERFNLYKISYKPNEFDLLVKIWNSWKKKGKNDEIYLENFFIFFGYSKYFKIYL